MLKRTICVNGCEYSKITSYCFDCPSLMCDKCELALHPNKNHEILKLDKSIKLQWNNKEEVLKLFKDVAFGNAVFQELTRTIADPIALDQVDTVGSWTCLKCTVLNPVTITKCSVCNIYKVTDDFKNEYRRKLMHVEDKFLSIADNLYDRNDVPLEHVIVCFQHSDYNIEEFDRWFEHKYLAGRDISVINAVVEQEGYDISMEDLAKKYSDFIQLKNTNMRKSIPAPLISEDLKQNKKLIQFADINKKNVLPDVFKKIEITEENLRDVIFQAGPYTESQERMIMTEMCLPSREKVNLLRLFLNDRVLGDYIKQSYESQSVTLDHIRQALIEYMLINDAILFLKRECLMCCGDFPMPEMQQFLTCDHEMCKTCFRSWLETTVETKFPCKWCCPVCDENRYESVDRTLHYFNLRRFLVDNESPNKFIGIFDQKLLNEQIMDSKQFRWCCNDQCEYGFEADAVKGKVQCRLCKTEMCVGCKRKWEDKHENISCQEFEMMMLTDDPSLGNMLNEIGIECPKCGMRYALAPGGCLHFDCKACAVQFCGSCYELFTNTCEVPGCAMETAFHGHHPRNCYYYLRDRSPAELQQMLEKTEYPRLKDKKETKCAFLICEKVTMLDKPCSEPVFETTGLCDNHYKEYLVQFINRSKIDPADYADSHNLNMMLFQGLKPRLEKLANESEAAFVARLKTEVIKLRLYVPKWLREEQVAKAEVAKAEVAKAEVAKAEVGKVEAAIVG